MSVGVSTMDFCDGETERDSQSASKGLTSEELRSLFLDDWDLGLLRPVGSSGLVFEAEKAY